METHAVVGGVAELLDGGDVLGSGVAHIAFPAVLGLLLRDFVHELVPVSLG